MPSSHHPAPKPSPLLALVCLAIVQRLRPSWTATTLAEAAAAEHVSAERLSRLASRVLAAFEDVVCTLTRRGRPPSSATHDAHERELAILKALIEVARGLLEHVPWRCQDVRARVVGAWHRLQELHPTLTQKDFCDTLALSSRTLRHWLRTTPAVRTQQPAATTTTERPRTRARPFRRPRFGFDVVLPDTQHAADTTDLRAFGVPLKLVAAQDVGGRDQQLFDAVIVDSTESADAVVRLLGDALAELPGAQLLTDQGTPYMARETRDALERLELEHAPQKEGDPYGKATVEKAFDSVKSILATLLTVTDRLAARVPALANPALARATVELTVGALLRAYQAGARAARRALEVRGTITAEELARAARDHRENARADDRSSRLILARVHAAYDIDGAERSFVDSFRRYSPSVILEAEKRFAAQAHRDDIRVRKSYFAKLVRAVYEEHHRERQRHLAERERVLRRAADQRCYLEQRARWNADPLAWLRDALDAFAAQWMPDTRSLLFGGAGVAHAWTKGALVRLVEMHTPCAARDIADAILRDWSRSHYDSLGPDAVAAVLDIIAPYLDAIPTHDDTLDCAARFASAMLSSTGPPSHPAPLKPLRN